MPMHRPEHPHADVISALLEAALPHVVFDGWSEETFRAAIADSETDSELARIACPRGAVDLAVAYHRLGDQRMVEGLKTADLTTMRFRDRVAYAIRLRLETVEDKEAVRRASALFALPSHAAEGAKLVWETCDLVWSALGDTSEDLNWYSKRATLSGVYGTTILYWLGDETPGHMATWEFLDRRIDNVMQIEMAKASARKNPLLKPLMAGQDWLFSQVKAPPARAARRDLPGAIWPEQ
ncbi:COQ9 family protein [Pseudoruegeria sp. SHC-113]|uniref:COQ9 family protein n=1 Tax=Pseudoruegeria sp. SHC-113 TaxID=2855439 RepID=UPI0021BAFBE0|nr:COQ9 family protein [Pseudoruegeria sp. SHC-113]MCT8158992.1 COQ9 family protein [Pseudoruegeria sp. SHC-113]